MNVDWFQLKAFLINRFLWDLKVTAIESRLMSIEILTQVEHPESPRTGSQENAELLSSLKLLGGPYTNQHPTLINIVFCALRPFFRKILQDFLDCPQPVPQVVEFLGADSTESEVLSRTPQWTLARYLRPNDAKRHAAWDFGRCQSHKQRMLWRFLWDFYGFVSRLAPAPLLPISSDLFLFPKIAIFGYMSCFLDWQTQVCHFFALIQQLPSGLGS